MTFSPSSRSERAASPIETKAFEGRLIELQQILKRAPGVAQPVGFSVETWGALNGFHALPGQPAAKTLPLAGSLDFGAFPIFEYQRNGKTIREDSGETELLLFRVNDLEANVFTGGHPEEWGSADTDAYLAPQNKGMLFGSPHLGETIVIRKNPKPIFAPVPLSEALKIVVDRYRQEADHAQEVYTKQVKEFETWQTPTARAARLKGYQQASASMKEPAVFLKQMEKTEVDLEAIYRKQTAPNGDAAKTAATAKANFEQADAMVKALTPTELATGTCYDAKATSLKLRFRNITPGMADNLVWSGTGCRPVVRPNYAYFDSKLPRSAPQVVVIWAYERCVDRKSTMVSGCAANTKLLETLDWKAVMEWLDR